MSSASKVIVAAVAIAAASMGAYWHFSPYLAMRSMQSAAQDRDADSFNENVDYPSLRESIKGQMSALVAPKLDDETKTSAFSMLGSAIGLALMNQMVEAFVRPEVVMKLMAEGKMSVGRPTSRTDGPGATEPSAPETKAEWKLKRVSADRVIVYQREEEALSGGQAGLVFSRHGFAQWKLSEIRLPSQKK